MDIIGTINTALSVARTLKDALEAKELMNLLFGFGCKSEIDDFKRTIEALAAVLQDAETKDLSSSHQLRIQIENLKDTFYEADDLLDEFATIAQQQRFLDSEGSLREKVSHFFSRSNPVYVSYWMSRGIKDIKKKLDAIACDKQFGFEHDPEPIRMRSRETCSYVNGVDIIGRGEDLEKIVGMLSDPSVQQDLSFLSIVGIGGLGKTALAQLVFNDPRVKSAFPLRMWTCVSDQDQKQLDVKEVLEKILVSATSCSRDGESTLDQVRSKLKQQLAGKRYLLVLDDVWTEERSQWCELVQYFVGGQRGSWVVVTTRSQQTATIIGGRPCQMHELKGLSDVDSRELFQRTAFGPDESNPPTNLVNFVGEIIDACYGVPLAIRVMGSLLYGQDGRKWQSIKKIGLANIRKSQGSIMSILKLSYHHLEAPLKICFSYCALFPKDFEMEKEMLISLWMAQGYIIPFYDGQSMENAGEEYFSILLKRCFFQDIKKNIVGEIVSCKMHDLIHDIAQSVSGKEIYVANTNSANSKSKIRHFSIPIKEQCKHSLDMTLVRSYVHVNSGLRGKVESSVVEALISSCKALRAFHLAGLQIKRLPDSMTILLHLRYLDLSYNSELEVLPKSFSKLYNLQTFKLAWCANLQELPKDLSRLVKLRVLDISHCSELTYMPRGMEKLTCLYMLSDFIVGNEQSFVSWKQWFDGLKDRKAPNGLIGNLRVLIKCPKNAHNVVTEVDIGQGSILRSLEHVDSIVIEFENEDNLNLGDEGTIALMEVLNPHPNLTNLEVRRYNGTRMPDWACLLPNLVKLEVHDCKCLKQWRREIVGAGDASSSGKNEEESLPCLPMLKSLTIENSPGLTWIPQCPQLELLVLREFNRRMVFGEVTSASTSTSCQEVANYSQNLKEIRIDNVAWLNLLPMKAFQCLERLEVSWDEELKTLGEVKEVFRSCSSSLKLLEISSCPKLKSVVGGGLEHLTALEVLQFNECGNLKLSGEEKEGENSGTMSCPSLPSLRTLMLRSLPKLENLPNWMQFLSALQTLEIEGCGKLRTMPNWMPNLTSLRNLHVQFGSASLERRCQKDPQGEDYPFIKHIRSIHFEYCDDDDDTEDEEEETTQSSGQSYSSDSDVNTDAEANTDTGHLSK